MSLTLDHQAAQEPCRHCGVDYKVARGCVYDDGEPVALYLAGMHGCHGGKNVALGIGLAPEGKAEPTATTLHIWAAEDEYQMSVMEPDDSPWIGHTYLGRHKTRAEILDSDAKTKVFAIADTVIASIPAIRQYLRASDYSEAT
jgi:hypothetical protein